MSGGSQSVPPGLSAEQAADKPGRKRPPPLMVAGVVLAVVVVAWKFVGAGRDAVSNAVDKLPSLPSPVQNQTLSQSAIDTQRQVEIDAMKQRMASLEEKLRRQPIEFGEQLNSVKSQLTRDIQGVVRVVEETSEERMRRQRLGASPGPSAGGALVGGVTNVTLPSAGGEFATEMNKEDPFPYRRLGGASLVQVNALAASLPTVSPPAASESSATPPPAVPLRPQTETGAAGEVAQPGRAARGADGKPSGPSISLPAYSYADLRTLHGVTCPVRTGATSALGLSETPAPITLPVVGPFRGPQGVEYEVGRIHMFGFCEGMDRKRPTGMIKVEGLSMVRADGTNFTVAVNGYVIDSRDNDLGVRGIKESVKGEQLALAMTASGISAVGDVFRQSQFDQIETQGGNIRQILRQGNIGDAIGGALIADSAKELASFFRQRANSMFDVIAIPGGAPLKLIIEETIQLPLDSEGLNETTDGRPLL